MRTPHLKWKALLVAAAFSVLIAGIAIYIANKYEKLSEDVIKTNMELCEVLALQLHNASKPVLDSLFTAGYFIEGFEHRIVSNNVDKLLSGISENTFKTIDGIEGGFFILPLDQFQGYSYPTSPPPIPVYGPPPRSYNFIKTQVLETIIKDSLIIKLHKFDPAIFPLATVPIKTGSETIGAIWTRTHIERDLPEFTLVDVLNIIAVVSLLGFIMAVTISIQLRNRVEFIRTDLEKLEIVSDHRLRELPGIFGYIVKSINMMVDALQEEHHIREELERELHQKDKMASLGKLIAGVAHEVKTPLAIIKTRIQMWQKKMSNDKFVLSEGSIDNSSMQMVIKEINRLTKLVNRLLIFSKPVNEMFVQTDINLLIKRVINFYKNKNIQNDLYISFEPSHLPKIEVDPDKIEQVLLNVITNSAESLENIGNIEINTKLSDNLIHIIIADDGPGIPLNIQKNIFDPFYTTKTRGTGLGLSIAYEIIKAHKGSIEFTSSFGDGCKFIIKLPINGY